MTKGYQNDYDQKLQHNDGWYFDSAMLVFERVSLMCRCQCVYRGGWARAAQAPRWIRWARPQRPPRDAAHLPRRSVHRHTPAWRLVLRARRHSLLTLASPARRFSLLPYAQFPAPSRRPGPFPTKTTRVSTLSNALRAILENLWSSRVKLKLISERPLRTTRLLGHLGRVGKSTAREPSSDRGRPRMRSWETCARPRGGRRHAVPAAAWVRVLRDAVRLLPAADPTAGTAPAPAPAAIASPVTPGSPAPSPRSPSR